MEGERGRAGKRKEWERESCRGREGEKRVGDRERERVGERE